VVPPRLGREVEEAVELLELAVAAVPEAEALQLVVKPQELLLVLQLVEEAQVEGMADEVQALCFLLTEFPTRHLRMPGPDFPVACRISRGPQNSSNNGKTTSAKTTQMHIASRWALCNFIRIPNREKLSRPPVWC
jgi:hypothetical protein